MFASRPSRLLSYLSNMLCNNFCEHFQKLYDWLKNTVRLFSAFCVMLGKFIWVYLWFSCLQVKTYLYFVISKELKPEGKQIPKKSEVIQNLTKSLDSVDLSQQTHQVTMPSHSQTNLILLDYGIAKDAGTIGLKTSRSNYQKYSPNERYYTEKYAASTLRGFKAEFPQLWKSTARLIHSNDEEDLKVALKQKREPRSTLRVYRYMYDPSHIYHYPWRKFFASAGKTKICLPRAQFSSSFSLSFNLKHYSNEEESIKVLNDIVIPYVAKEREKLSLNEGQAALLIMDVFKGQMTDPVLKVLSNKNIFCCKVYPLILPIYSSPLTFKVVQMDLQNV